MRAPLDAALETVALRLGEAGVPFLLGGSALLDALGLDVEVRDLDLMLRRQPIREQHPHGFGGFRIESQRNRADM
jgi:hypothetical protein